MNDAPELYVISVRFWFLFVRFFHRLGWLNGVERISSAAGAVSSDDPELMVGRKARAGKLPVMDMLADPHTVLAGAQRLEAVKANAVILAVTVHMSGVTA